MADWPDLFTAYAARDEALERVSEHAGTDWNSAALNAIRRLKGQEVTGEDIRLYAEPQIGKPPHHNAWGALIRTAKHQNLLVATGRWQPMRTPKSHARPTPVYRVPL